MNRKILLTVLALAVVLLATPYIGMVHAAGKGTTKQDYEFFLKGSEAGGPDTKAWDVDDGIVQVRSLHYVATFIEVTVGGTKYYPDPASYSATIDLTLDLNTMKLNIRVHETFAMPDGGIITQDTAEMVTGYMTPDMAGGGSFVGFGSGALEGVKIQGKTQMAINPIYGLGLDRVGTVMGWPD